MTGKNQHVTPHPGGGWQVKGEKNTRATARASTKQKAVDIARDIATNQKSELVIHGKDGTIQSKDSHGHDPFPPEG